MRRLLASIALLAPLAFPHLATAQSVDTLEVSSSVLGLPAVAAFVVGDILPTWGVEHVVWTKGAGLRHAQGRPGSWSLETLADSATSYDVGIHGFALGSVAFADPSGRLIEAEQSGPGAWALDTLASYPGSSLQVSLAPPAIAFVEAPPSGTSKLRYAYRSGASWTTLTLDSDVGNSSAPAIAFDRSGRPQVAYVKGSGATSAVVLLAGAGTLGPFTSQTVGDGLAPVTITWDTGRDRPFVGYRGALLDYPYREYRVAWRDLGGNWSSQQVRTTATDLFGIALTVDPTGAPACVWTHSSNIVPNRMEQPECTFFSVATVHLSRQPAGVPTESWSDEGVPLFYGDGDNVNGERAVASTSAGVFDVCVRSPRVVCTPYAILVGSFNENNTGVPPAVPTEPVRFDVWPTPRVGDASVRIVWTQPRAGEARIEVHDLVGRRVASLEPGWLPAGEHEQGWSAAGLAAGVYWVSLRLDGERVARRMYVSL